MAGLFTLVAAIVLATAGRHANTAATQAETHTETPSPAES
jgi:hypothetical protein